MNVYYNEIDDYCIFVLRELMESGIIPKGYIDTRSIEDVVPSELAGYDQCHFFAGIGVWAYVTKDCGRLWTGSCPCQPFSQAGKRKGMADERHLWPAFFHLISQCLPSVVFGEQVGGKAALAWIDLVQNDLEGCGYSCWAKNFPAASVGAPHIRQRIYWCGIRDNNNKGLERHWRDTSAQGWTDAGGSVAQTGRTCGLCYSDGDGDGWKQGNRNDSSTGYGNPAPTNGFWRDVEWLPYKDGKWRPIKPGTFPLAHGFAGRIPLLSALGNTLVAPQAEIFKETVMELVQ